MAPSPPQVVHETQTLSSLTARVSPRKNFNDLVEYSDMRNRGGVIERLKNFKHGVVDLGVGALTEWVPVITML